jgi:hypothetical protein
MRDVYGRRLDPLVLHTETYEDTTTEGKEVLEEGDRQTDQEGDRTPPVREMRRRLRSGKR